LEVTVSRNTLKTFLLLAALGGMFVLVGGLIASRAGALVGLAVGLLVVGWSYCFSASLAVRAARARRVTAAENPRLAAIVTGLTSRAGMPTPDLYVSPSAQPNAFATGRNPGHAAVCVTQGALDLLDDEELRGVLSHELSHVANRDTLIASIAAAIALALTVVARMAMWGTLLGGGRGRRGNPIGVLAMALLAPLAAIVVQMAISRSREFEADRSGADMLGTGEPLARALVKIDAAARAMPMDVDPAHATAYIVNPLAGRRVAFAQLFATHPPTADRVARLHDESRRLGHVG
jgi:heat shock protein HtpX